MFKNEPETIDAHHTAIVEAYATKKKKVRYYATKQIEPFDPSPRVVAMKKKGKSHVQSFTAFTDKITKLQKALDDERAKNREKDAVIQDQRKTIAMLKRKYGSKVREPSKLKRRK
jgi:hypothetical protein